MTNEVNVEVLTRDAAMKESLTPGGKQLGVYPVAQTSLYGIKFGEGGVLPPKLTGRWTNVEKAQKEIELYLKAMWDETERLQAEQARKRSRAKQAKKVAKEEADSDAQTES